ncbi:hypothetical protein HMSSN036_60470 [Paenibacillus macerans]|nr:hypothetical protein HMSSN036_60470 [Paenibacillus macerans]
MVNIFPYEFNNRVLGAAILIREAGQVRKAVNQIAGFKANYSFEDIVTRHPAMLETIAFAKKIARTDCTVLIEGESGTGKELFAQSIHQASSRANGPFIAINCAALPKELVESELFGYEKGSFTGALREGSPGKFELAHGGTLFLDEVGELSLEIQAKLLRVLDNHKVRRIGDGMSGRWTSGSSPRRTGTWRKRWRSIHTGAIVLSLECDQHKTVALAGTAGGYSGAGQDVFARMQPGEPGAAEEVQRFLPGGAAAAGVERKTCGSCKISSKGRIM